MRKTLFTSALAYTFCLIVSGVFLGAPVIAGDAAKGEAVFKRCKACHYADKDKNKTGPHLVDVIGRKAGSLEGFKYSKAMRESQLVWDEATLIAYLKAPKKFLKGTKMAFAGLKKEADIENVIAYLKSPK
ncbi:MAG: cytochrome c family protein [Candidatus Puniceispirillum sp.]|nr:cytochrome c family protein [Candidatus Puniceispirillum sp.]